MYYEIKLKRAIVIIASLILCYSLEAQKGKDGAETYTTGTNILNRYAVLAAPVSAGSPFVLVTNITDLYGSTSFTNSVNSFGSNELGFGDIIMLVQVQGADINISDSSSYGKITALNNTGNYEFAQVFYVAGNQINLCNGTARSYNQGGRAKTQVIRVPRLTNLSIAAAATVSAKPWNGSTGGVVAIETNSNIAINGTISADAAGSRGGTDEINGTIVANLATGASFYRRVATDSSAEKGESIAGDSAAYASLNGGNGRGAPANGGGGGNGHNCGGGGGSNAAVNNILTPYNGTGIKDTTGNWDLAWNLEAPNFALDSSVGGGRGGYSFSNADRNALTEGAGLPVWGGDGRDNYGGFGGHPLDYSSGNLLFMGGGGGAGDGNNGHWGNGGNGGGIIYILTNGNISGRGSIHADGQNGHTTRSAVFGNDAAGGAGAGGAIKVLALGTITGITIHAHGGTGGLQTINAVEAEGPGGGGGGGYILTTATTITKSVTGGANGTTNSTGLTEFIPNGATKGAAGTTATAPFADLADLCNPLPVTLVDFNAIKNKTKVSLVWSTAAEINTKVFDIERSADESNWNRLLSTPAKNAAGILHYTAEDSDPEKGKNFYRLKMIDKDDRYRYSRVIRIDLMMTSGVRVYPNPVKGNVLHIESPAIIEHLQLFNSTGQLVMTKDVQANSSLLTLPALSPGLYQLKIIAGSELIIKKLSIGQ